MVLRSFKCVLLNMAFSSIIKIYFVFWNLLKQIISRYNNKNCKISSVKIENNSFSELAQSVGYYKNLE